MAEQLSLQTGVPQVSGFKFMSVQQFLCFILIFFFGIGPKIIICHWYDTNLNTMFLDFFSPGLPILWDLSVSLGSIVRPPSLATLMAMVFVSSPVLINVTNQDTVQDSVTMYPGLNSDISVRGGGLDFLFNCKVYHGLDLILEEIPK